MYKYNAFLNKIFTLRSNLDVKNMKNPNNICLLNKKGVRVLCFNENLNNEKN
jgi:hypothetical protein